MATVLRGHADSAVASARREPSVHRAERRIVVTLAAVLALSSADLSALGTVSGQLQRALHIDKGGIGLLLSVTGVMGALATVPAGRLVDRVHRVLLLRRAVLLWAAASLASAFASSFGWLFGTRCLLGLLTSVAGPGVASLLGSYARPEDRARLYGSILAGELVGTGFGFLVAGELAAITWRLAFAIQVVPALVVAWMLRRLPEPERPRTASPADGARLPLHAVARYVLSVRTNLVLIFGGALSYFFLAGLQGFGVQFLKTRFGVAQSVATALIVVIGAGAIVGVSVSGRLADRLQRGGRVAARVEIGGWAMAATTLCVVPALLLHSLVLALLPLFLGGVLQGATNPPLDAARLDVVSSALWGQAEGIRAVAKTGAQALAPLLFGMLAAHAFSGHDALRDTFAVMLLPLAASGVLVAVLGRRTYPRDRAEAAREAPVINGD